MWKKRKKEKRQRENLSYKVEIKATGTQKGKKGGE
jgi:hypothetical protein